MYLPKEALFLLWQWAKDKHTAEIAEATGRSSQHVRNVLKGLAEDGEVIQQAVEIRKTHLQKNKQAALAMLKELSTT